MKKRCLKILSVLFVGLVIFSSAALPLPQAETIKVKSAYLINFVRFIQWPEGKKGEITIGFVGETDLEDYLNKTKSIAEKRGKMRINIIHFNSAEAVSSCDILYVTDTKILKKNQGLIDKCKKENILTVTSKNLKRPDNSCINFVLVNNKLRFEIDNTTLQTNNLKASAQLLKLSYKR